DGRWQFLPRLRFGHRSLGLWFGLRRGLLLWVQVRPHFGGGQLGFGFAWRGLLVRWNDVRREKVDVIFARSRSFRRGVEAFRPMGGSEADELLPVAAGEIGHVDGAQLACDRGESGYQRSIVSVQQYDVGILQNRDLLGAQFLAAECGKPEAFDAIGLFF